MAKTTITGNALVIESAIKREDLAMVAKYRPDALILKGGEDGKTPIFAIAPGKGVGEISKFGVTFGEPAHGDLATVTAILPTVDGSIKEFVADKYGSALMNLAKLEESIPAVVDEIAAEKAQILNGITLQ